MADYDKINKMNERKDHMSSIDNSYWDHKDNKDDYNFYKEHKDLFMF